MIEPAVSIERIFVAMLCDAYDEEVVGERERTVLRLHPLVAPVKAAVLPLIAKDEGMSSRARSLFEELRRRHTVEYDDSGQIGRRYRRQDEIGTPWAFTVDDQTLEDETVTVRDRDSLAQERLPLAGVAAWLDDALQRPWGLQRHEAASLLVALAVLGVAAGCGGTKTVTETQTATVVQTTTVHVTTQETTPAATACTGDAMTGTFTEIPGSPGAGQIVLPATREERLAGRLLRVGPAERPTARRAVPTCRRTAERRSRGRRLRRGSCCSPAHPRRPTRVSRRTSTASATRRTGRVSRRPSRCASHSAAAPLDAPITPPTSVCERGTLSFTLFSAA